MQNQGKTKNDQPQEPELKGDNTMATRNVPRHERFFSAARPFDATKDDHLLDALQQAIEVSQDAGMRCGFTIEADGAGVAVTRPGDDLFRGATVREALAAAFNAE